MTDTPRWFPTELILGKENMKDLVATIGNGVQDSVNQLGFGAKLRLLSLYRKTQKSIDLLVDVQGHQILHNGIFNGDPHPGNILALSDGSLGLIDYGQTKSISTEERLGVARVVHALGNGSGEQAVANAMRQLGFQTKHDKDDVLAKYATLFFDSDMDGKLIGCATPQLYFASLTKWDPLVNVPDVASKSRAKKDYVIVYCTVKMRCLTTAPYTFSCSICSSREFHSARNGNHFGKTNSHLNEMVVTSQTSASGCRIPISNDSRYLKSLDLLITCWQ